MTEVTPSGPLLRVDRLDVRFRGPNGSAIRAVDDVSFDIGRGETVALVGESGSGKSTIGRAVLGLTPARSGRIEFAGTDITQASRSARRALGRRLQVVFQDPYSSLNAARSIADTLADSIRALGLPRTEARRRITGMLDRVGLPAAAADRYPKDLSGGQRQRVAIARALIAEPELVICDEAVSALDLSVQAQVLNLLRELQQEMGVSYLFISHDLAVVSHVSQRVLVMYRGRIVEEAPAASVYREPAHPYTAMLLASAPVPDPERARRPLTAAVPVDARPVGEAACNFAPRCPFATEACRLSRPEEQPTGADSSVACHRWPELTASLHARAWRGAAA